MIKIVKQRMKKDEEEGFTLIELLVVVLILGILMAIAIPTFLSLTSGAKTNAAESDMTTATQDEATYFTQNGTYDASSASNVTDMKAIDTGINWTATVPPASSTAGTKTVGVNWISGSEVVLSTAGQNGSIYYVDDKSGTLSYDVGTATTTQPTPAAPVTWGNSWKSATTS